MKRYNGEPILNQLIEYYGDKNFNDSNLFSMTFFAYKKEACKLMQEWFLHNALWTIEDQISFPYLLQKSGLTYSLFDGDITHNQSMFECKWEEIEKNFI